MALQSPLHELLCVAGVDLVEWPTKKRMLLMAHLKEIGLVSSSFIAHSCGRMW